ncbi:hypothetical protein LTR50_002915 [Elasticomyces elasticus]|nr:hypothetical protein LTR50_002915 [Elasticomyces elasticus]
MDNGSILDSAASALKRKRSPSTSTPMASAPPVKAAKPNNHLQINYLARQCIDDLPLLTKDESLPTILNLLTAYAAVLDRHESLASNLGARPLGPILIKRFERCFETPPQVITSHSKGALVSNSEGESNQVSWLDVIDFARTHPTQFTLATFSEGRRVCQFYFPQKQVRVQISEEDFLFINSGRCQELIPPLPIWEDEEKEVGTCEILEARLRELTNAADMVAARTRQLAHRLKGRRMAILERRAGEDKVSTVTQRDSSTNAGAAPQEFSRHGFTAVNAQSRAEANGVVKSDEPSLCGADPAVRAELMRHFESLPHDLATPASNFRRGSLARPVSTAPTTFAPATYPSGSTAYSVASDVPPAPISPGSSHTPAPQEHNLDPLSYYVSTPPPRTRPSFSSTINGPLATTPNAHHSSSQNSGKHNFSRPLPPSLESAQPYRPLLQQHMDVLTRGTRVIPPCDRCRRLKMDCVKNLTSCMGCTKKHARCHWRDVSYDEINGLDGMSGNPSNISGCTVEGSGRSIATSASAGDYEEGDGDGRSSNDGASPANSEAVERMIPQEEGLGRARELARRAQMGKYGLPQSDDHDPEEDLERIMAESEDRQEPIVRSEQFQAYSEPMLYGPQHQVIEPTQANGKGSVNKVELVD